MYPATFLLSAALSLASHPCIDNPKTEECVALFASINQGDAVDGEPGSEWYHNGHKWDTRPRVHRLILTELPSSPNVPSTCKNPYSYAIDLPGNDCSNQPAPEASDIGKPEWVIGVSYNPAYPGAVFTVTNISYSTKRPGTLIITGEWNTEGTMPLSFYSDSQPGPFFQVR